MAGIPPAGDVPPGRPAKVESARRPGRRSGALRGALNLAVAFLLAGLIIWKIDLDELRESFGDFEPWPALLSAALTVPVLALMTIRGQITLRSLGHDIDFGALLPISTFGNVLGNLTPGAAGDLLRTPFIRSRHDVAYGEGLAAVVYERVFSVFVLALGTGLAAGWLALPVPVAIAATVATLTIAAVGPLGAGVLLAKAGPGLFRSRDERGPSLLARLRDTLTMSFESLAVLLGDRRATALLLLVNASIFSIMALQFWLVGISLDFTLKGLEAWAIFGAALLTGIFTLLPLGLGTFDVVLASLLAAVGYNGEIGAASALLVRATMTLPQGTAAILAYLYLTTGSPLRQGRS